MDAIDSDLPSIMHEIAEAVGARGAALTLHDDGNAPLVLFGSAASGLSDEVIRQLERCHRGSSANPLDGRCQWLRGAAAQPSSCILILPVERVPLHGQLLVSAFFGELTDDQRQAAEAVYAARRPFAVGYFRMLQLYRVNMRRAASLEATLHRSAMGVVLLDRDGKAMWMNSSASTTLSVRDGLRCSNRLFYANKPSSSLELRIAIDEATSRGSCSGNETFDGAEMVTLAIKRVSGPPLMVSVLSSIEQAETAGDVAAMLFIVDPLSDDRDLLADTCKVLGLTNVEARLASLLTVGMTISAAAQSLRIKDDTARSYLKSVFTKTGTNRQAALVRLILSSVVRTHHG